MNELTRDELIRRLLIVNEELIKLNEAIYSHGIDIHVEDKHGCGIATYLTNISICADIDSNGAPKDIDGFRVETKWKLKSEL